MELADIIPLCMTDSYYIDNMRNAIKRVFFVSLFLPGFLFAQKFHFQNFNVQQGLIQSQVAAIAQDRYDNLWFCTLGGISRFDGKVFTNYSETDGLISNYANAILADHDSNIWVGTVYGISKFDGAVFKNIRISDSMATNVVRSLQEDGMHRVWVLAGGKLYRMETGDKPVHVPVSGMNEWLSTINVDNEGNLWAAVRGKGIYRQENEIWKLEIPFQEHNEYWICQKMVFDRENKGRVFLLTSNEILSAEKGIINPLIQAGTLGKMINFYQDRSGKLWIASWKGLFQYADSGLIAFNPDNGYEGSSTSVIFQDHESNIWFGTNGTGVFRYSFQPFLIFDQFSASKDRNVMPMLENQNQLYIGTEGAGLFVYDGKKIAPFKNLPDDPAYKNITGLYPAADGGIYIQTSSGLLLSGPDGKISKVPLGDIKGCINSIIPDEAGGFWVASCLNLAYISPAGKTTIVMDLSVHKIFAVSKDSILAGADEGLYMVAKDFKLRKIENPLLNRTGFMSLDKIGKYFLLATSNRGFILYNSVTDQCRQFTTKDGLNSDFIYSVITDHKTKIWLGTGRGINKIIIDTASGTTRVSNLSIPGDISSAESNQGAGVYDSGNNLWFGTVAGLFKFLSDSGIKQTYMPPVVLQEVEVFSKEIPASRYSGLQNNWYTIPKNLVLSHNENHLTFSFRCPSFMRSESILYQYQLEGMEKSYSALTPNHFVIYPSLPPGHYTFRARAYVEGVGYSQENAAFSFDIRAAFYQTLYFKFLMLLLVMGIILWIQWLRMRMRMDRLNQLEEVKRDENIKVRQTASEDFHDEVGNSLTRIQVLTDVLQTKLGNGHDEEKRIIGQIKENVSGLYQGTRDILWALNPESDLIKEIGHRLESLGIDVFQDTGICFKYENQLGESESLKLPGNYNRNIMMIFKEAMSNCLKHAQARHVKLKIQKSGPAEILIGLSDDGIGFNTLFIKKGHGFQNMQKRANRMKALFMINSAAGEGSCYELRIPVMPV